MATFEQITADYLASLSPYYEKAKAASDGGKLKLVSEKLCQPFEGHGFELKKGQVIRYELTHGPQIIDTMYLVKSRTNEEWACTYNTSHFGAQALVEGTHFLSNTPYARPLLSFIKDTVDIEPVKKDYGKSATHSYVYNAGRCNAGILERSLNIPHCTNCDGQMLQGIVEVAGEKVARGVKIPMAFMHFQLCHFESVPMKINLIPGGRFGDYFKKHDYVELLAHEDLYVGISPCPVGDQNNTADFRNMTNFPFRVSIWEGTDATLETIADPGHESMDAVDWIMAGRPGMVHGKIGEEQF